MEYLSSQAGGERPSVTNDWSDAVFINNAVRVFREHYDPEPNEKKIPTHERLWAVTNVAEQWRQNLPPTDELDRNSPMYLSNVEARLFMDSVQVIGHDQLICQYCFERRPRKDIHEQIRKEIAASRSMQGHIRAYNEAVGMDWTLPLYLKIFQSMEDAYSFDLGKKQLQEKHRKFIMRILRGILGEHKVLQHIRQNGWPEAQHAPIEEDLFWGVDVTVPLSRGFVRRLPLQVRASFALRKLVIKRGKTAPEICVPMPERPNGMFNLASDEGRKVVDFVKTVEAL